MATSRPRPDRLRAAQATKKAGTRPAFPVAARDGLLLLGGGLGFGLRFGGLGFTLGFGVLGFGLVLLVLVLLGRFRVGLGVLLLNLGFGLLVLLLDLGFGLLVVLLDAGVVAAGLASAFFSSAATAATLTLAKVAAIRRDNSLLMGNFLEY
ncbi:MAG: hypothetical protein MZW92_01030 [Comamonadaceae bacterium]|nr:hypothetical protein [Comamonadaceae bacterium]